MGKIKLIGVDLDEERGRGREREKSLSRYSQRDAFGVATDVIRGFTEKTRKQGVRIKRAVEQTVDIARNVSRTGPRISPV